ncbi:hypothetical protein MTO96_048022 [Rhipicephalus appendiculatus]|uniref:Secreted protein n=1 Tax=Rhipicephalus appendiculatus TaxID=34631 RepID=A0A131YHM5_RHIAP
MRKTLLVCFAILVVLVVVADAVPKRTTAGVMRRRTSAKPVSHRFEEGDDSGADYEADERESAEDDDLDSRGDDEADDMMESAEDRSDEADSADIERK